MKQCRWAWFHLWYSVCPNWMDFHNSLDIRKTSIFPSMTSRMGSWFHKMVNTNLNRTRFEYWIVYHRTRQIYRILPYNRLHLHSIYVSPIRYNFIYHEFLWYFEWYSSFEYRTIWTVITFDCVCSCISIWEILRFYEPFPFKSTV